MSRTRGRRYLAFLLGVVFTALGIALVTQAGKGTSAVASPAYVLSCLFPLPMGTFTMVVNLVMIVVQIVLMKRDFFPEQLLQLPAGVLFGGLIDLFRGLLGDQSGRAGPAWLCLAAGCVVLGLGVGLQQLGDVLMLPSEGAVRAIARATGKGFHQVKVCFDVGLVTLAAAVSMLALGKVVGIREGTLVVALVTGPISRFFHDRLAGVLSKERQGS